jgi:hypothetical protein
MLAGTHGWVRGRFRRLASEALNEASPSVTGERDAS